MTRLSFVICFFMVIVFSSCDENHLEKYADQEASGSLTLSFDNHPHGYGQSECFYCHVEENLHQEPENLGTGLLDDARAAVRDTGINACSTCHGSNGVN